VNLSAGPSEPRHRPVHLFISATDDLERVREIIGQVVARLPVSLGWEIVRTPRQGEPLQPALEAVAGCDLYLILLGRDIAAPAGVEWDVAHRSGKKPLAFLNDVLRTPAAQAFVRATGDHWTLFATERELACRVQAALIEHLLAGPLRYGLSVVEYETLSALSEAASAHGEATEPLREKMLDGGAGGGGVILGPHSLPSGGVPLPWGDWEARRWRPPMPHAGRLGRND